MPKTQKKEESISRSETAAILASEFNKKMKGRATISIASTIRLPYITKRLPTGLLTLDLALGGGFPAAGISQIVGPKNSCKSFLYWQVIRQLQEILGDKMSVLLAMTEMRADKTQGRKSGVEIALADEDINELNLARKDLGQPEFTAEEKKLLKRQVGNIQELHAESAELLFDAILKGIESRAYHLIVIDSVGSLISEAESEAESLTQKTYGGAAKPITEFLRKAANLFSTDNENGEVRDTCVLAINQVRDAIGDPYKTYRSTGGRALEHFKLIDLFITSSSVYKEEEPTFTPSGTKPKPKIYAKEVNWKIEKGKAGIHEGAIGTFVYDFRINSVDFYTDTLVAGVQHGIVEVSGAWFGILNPEDPGKYIIRCHGKDAFVKALIDDANEKNAKGEAELSLMNLIRRLCLSKAGIHVHYDWD